METVDAGGPVGSSPGQSDLVGDLGGLRMWETTLKRLMDSLHQRVVRYIDRQDPTGILDPRALDEAGQLAAAVYGSRGSSQAVDALSLLAWLHYCRYRALPDGQDQEDLQSAIELTGIIYAINPELVPPALLPLLAFSPNAILAEDDLGRAANEAIRRKYSEVP